MSSAQPTAASRQRALPARSGKSSNAASIDLAALTRASGDQLRLDILRLLARESFAVQELCRVFDMAQPALSHHLKILLQAGLLARRREGTSVFYRRTAQHLDFPDVVSSLFAAIDALPPAANQSAGVDAVHAERRTRSLEFFSANATLLAEQRRRICDPETYAEAAAELLDLAATKQPTRPRGVALEIGPGEGQLLDLLAARFDRVLGIDSAERMLERIDKRVRQHPNVRLRLQDFADLPARRSYHTIAAAMVLHHQPSPEAFFQQVARILKPGGVLIVVDLCRHDQEWVRETCGDFWLGFEPDELLDWSRNAGLSELSSQYLTQNNGFQVQLHTFAQS